MRAAASRSSSSSRAIVADAVLGCVGCGSRAEDRRACSPRRTRTSPPTALLTHRHTAEMEQALTQGRAARPVQVLFTPHLVPTTRGILATCYAAPGDVGAVDRAAARALPRVLRERSVRVRGRRAVGHQGDVRRQRRARHRALRRPHRHRRRDRGGGQSRQGRVGPDGPGRQPAARPARDDRPRRSSGSSREHHGGRGVRRGRRCACGIKDVGRARSRARRDRRSPRRCPAAAVFTTNLAQAAPVQISRAHLADGRAAAVVLSSRQRQRRDRRAGPARRARACASSPAEASASRPTDVLVCSTGLIGIPMPMAALESRHPQALRRPSAPTAAPTRRRAMLTTDTVPQGGDRARRRDAMRRRDGQGRGDALARDGDDARGAHDRRRGRARRCCAARSPNAVAETFDCLSVDGCRSHERHRDRCSRTAAPAARDRRRPRSVDALTDACAVRSPSRWRATPKARRSSCASWSSARAPTPRPGSRPGRSRNSQLVQCSLNGGDAYWGRVLSELGASGAFIDPEQVDIAYNGVTVCRDGIACAHDAAALDRGHGRPRDRRCTATSARRTARRRCSRPISRTRTSTRTGGRRDAGPTMSERRRQRVRPRRGEKAVDPRRGAARTSASSRARPS